MKPSASAHLVHVVIVNSYLIGRFGILGPIGPLSIMSIRRQVTFGPRQLVSYLNRPNSNINNPFALRLIKLRFAI